MSEGRDEKGKFPYEGGTIERMKFKYPDITTEFVRIDLKEGEYRTYRELETIWNGSTNR